METLKDKVILIVGGGTGIGLGTGVAFAREGCRVVLAARTAASLDAARKLPGVGPALLTRVCDAADRAQVAELVAWTTKEVGPIDVLVFSAGVNVPKRTFAEMDPDDFARVMGVNAAGAFNCMHAVLPAMRARKAGLIINIVSIAGRRASLLGGLPYVASKYAQSAVGQFANLEVLPDGVRVTNVYPGETETPILAKRAVQPTAEHRARMLQPEDVADMIVAVAKLPARAVVPELVITPRYMPFV
jgi:NADP-dependent 3-hydroxy acid dehydrogenase YdfG